MKLEESPSWPPFTAESLEDGEKRHLSTQLNNQLYECVCLLFIPNVNTMKMMTATPSSIAIQLSTIDRRPYFLAPSISPVWRTDLD